MTEIRNLINGLFDKDNKSAYSCFQELETLSAKNNTIYQYFDVFAEMLESDNSFIRSRGLLLISSNAQWDEDCKVDEIIGRYLKHITDIKPITARQCIKALPYIAKHKPELKNDILLSLKCADISKYKDSMQPLVTNDISDAITKIKNDSK